MTKLDKLKVRLLEKPKDFRYEELEALLLAWVMKKRKQEKLLVREGFLSIF